MYGVYFDSTANVYLYFLPRSRRDYLSQLKKDLCMYYSYNDYLMDKLMALFPNQVMLSPYIIYCIIYHKTIG